MNNVETWQNGETSENDPQVIIYTSCLLSIIGSCWMLLHSASVAHRASHVNPNHHHPFPIRDIPRSSIHQVNRGDSQNQRQSQTAGFSTTLDTNSKLIFVLVLLNLTTASAKMANPILTAQPKLHVQHDPMETSNSSWSWSSFLPSCTFQASVLLSCTLATTLWGTCLSYSFYRSLIWRDGDRKRSTWISWFFAFTAVASVLAAGSIATVIYTLHLGYSRFELFTLPWQLVIIDIPLLFLLVLNASIPMMALHKHNQIQQLPRYALGYAELSSPSTEGSERLLLYALVKSVQLSPLVILRVVQGTGLWPHPPQLLQTIFLAIAYLEGLSYTVLYIIHLFHQTYVVRSQSSGSAPHTSTGIFACLQSGSYSLRHSDTTVMHPSLTSLENLDSIIAVNCKDQRKEISNLPVDHLSSSSPSTNLSETPMHLSTWQASKDFSTSTQNTPFVPDNTDISSTCSEKKKIKQQGNTPKCPQLSIFVSTFNMGEENVSQKDLHKWIPLGYEVYVIGVQECMHLNEFQNFVKEYLSSSTSQYVHFSHDIGNRVTALGYHGFIAITVFVTKEAVDSGRFCMRNRHLMPKKAQEICRGKSLALFGRTSNKGAVGLSFKYKNTSFAFVTCHLASDSSTKKISEEQRMEWIRNNGSEASESDFSDRRSSISSSSSSIQKISSISPSPNIRGVSDGDSSSESDSGYHLMKNFPRGGSTDRRRIRNKQRLKRVPKHFTKTKLSRRNEDAQAILNQLFLEEEDYGFGFSQLHHHAFLLGDFNYRMQRTEQTPSGMLDLLLELDASQFQTSDQVSDDSSSFQSSEAVENSRSLKEFLQKHDELLALHSANHLFHGFHEPSIHFYPTFRRIRGQSLPSGKRLTIEQLRQNYSLQAAHGVARVPSYTDRILYTSLPGAASNITCLKYTSCEEIQTSDHKPVSAIFQVDLPRGNMPMQTSIQRKRRKRTSVTATPEYAQISDSRRPSKWEYETPKVSFDGHAPKFSRQDHILRSIEPPTQSYMKEPSKHVYCHMTFESIHWLDNHNDDQAFVPSTSLPVMSELSKIDMATTSQETLKRRASMSLLFAEMEYVEVGILFPLPCESTQRLSPKLNVLEWNSFVNNGHVWKAARGMQHGAIFIRTDGPSKKNGDRNKNRRYSLSELDQNRSNLANKLIEDAKKSSTFRSPQKNEWVRENTVLLGQGAFDIKLPLKETITLIERNSNTTDCADDEILPSQRLIIPLTVGGNLVGHLQLHVACEKQI